jgi:hypothetical protein
MIPPLLTVPAGLSLLPRYRPSVAPPATWPLSSSARERHTPRPVTCGPWAVCCTSVPRARRPSWTPPSTSWCWTFSTRTQHQCQVRDSCRGAAGAHTPDNGDMQLVAGLALRQDAAVRLLCLLQSNSLDVSGVLKASRSCTLASFLAVVIVYLVTCVLARGGCTMCLDEGHTHVCVTACAAGASPEFSHLLCRLLDKNPATRIKWQVRSRTGPHAATVAHHHNRQSFPGPV